MNTLHLFEQLVLTAPQKNSFSALLTDVPAPLKQAILSQDAEFIKSSISSNPLYADRTTIIDYHH